MVAFVLTFLKVCVVSSMSYYATRWQLLVHHASRSLLLHLHQFHAMMFESLRLLSIGYGVCVMFLPAKQSWSLFWPPYTWNWHLSWFIAEHYLATHGHYRTLYNISNWNCHWITHFKKQLCCLYILCDIY